MARKSGGRYWSAQTLFARGWTNDLMHELLPKPRLFESNGRRHRQWPRERVLEAEGDPRFLERTPGQALTPQEARETGSAAREAAACLERAWALHAEAPPEPDAASVSPEAAALAALYHRGLMERQRQGELRRVRGSQSMAYLNQFLSLEKHSEGGHAPNELRNLLRALPWLGGELNHALSRRVLERYRPCLLALAARAAADFAEAQPEADLGRFLAAPDFPAEKLFTDGLGTVYAVWYVPRAIRTSLELLVALNPKDEYPEARAMRRRFVLHIGGTNTGKTYAGFQRLKQAKTGVYLAPLRLLALEAQETLLDAGVDCSLSTGEEEDRRDYDTHVAATAEKLDLKRVWEVAVIDECQMIADPQRGYAWTRAILGVLAPEVHLCAAPEARWLLQRLVESCGDHCEVELHQRQTPLLCMQHTVDYEHIQPGDALITFSKVGVLSVAEDLRQQGKMPAIIYGALPYATRRRQMEGFLAGKMRYVVSTDAIGMGLNLPIRRVIFMDSTKFDGTERRELRPAEIQQIAGRAGRYGMYDKGYVGATQDLGFIRAGLKATVPPLQTAVAGFSELVLQVDFDLLEVLTE